MVAQGTTLAGRYRLDVRLGAGGMGEVWRGEDTVLARTVAVKLLLPDRMNDPGFAVRFQGEARAMATINHPGVVDVYDYGVTEVPGDGPTAFLVMRFVDGEPLDRLLSRLGRIDPEPAMDLIAQAADAMQAVHEKGIVHRDIKPGNLLVRSDGQLVLTDFGIARAESANRLTDAGMVLGTAAYCAPEQAEGAPVTPAVDIYALGVVAYECLVGQRPFDGDSAVTIALKHIREAPPPLPADIPQPVRRLVDIALSKDPARRYPNARAMSEAARAIASGQAPAAPEALSGLSGAPSTGATMAPPSEAYQQAGSYQPHENDPYQTGARLAQEDTAVSERRGSRRAAKAPRRTGLVAGIAAAVVLGAGAGAVALTGITTTTASEPTQTATSMANEGGKKEEKPKTSKPPRPTRTPETRPEPTRIAEQTVNRPSSPKPTVTRSTPVAEEPTKTPTTTPSASPTPTTSPSASPSVKKVLVPNVVGRRLLEAQGMIEAAGLQPVIDDRTTTTDGRRCGRIKQTTPGPNKAVTKGTEVTLVLIDSVCDEDGPPETPTPTPTPSKAS